MSNRDYRQLARDRLSALASGTRIGMFVSVGVLGAVCDTAVLVLLTEGFGVYPELATLAGIETAILVMFLVNENWTFAGEGGESRESLLSRLKRSHAVRAAGVTTQFLVFVVIYRLLFHDVVLGDIPLWTALTEFVGLGSTMTSLDVWLLVAKGTGIAIGMVVNYVFESLFTWRVHE